MPVRRPSGDGPDDQPLGQGGGPGRGVSGHSGRVGLARQMARAGAPDSAIMRQVRWSSSAMVARYTRGESAGDAARWLELRARAGALWFLCFIMAQERVSYPPLLFRTASCKSRHSV